MVSDDDLTEKISELLDKADLTTTTTSLIRKQLEQEFGIDLSDRKSFVREKVDLYLHGHHQSQHEEGEGKEGNCKEEDGQEQPEAAAIDEENENDDEDGEEREAIEGEEEEEDNEGDDNDDDDDEDDKLSFIPERDSRRFQAKLNRAKKESLQKEKRKRSGGGGFTKLCRLSPELQALTGQEEWSRTQVVKFIWGYIRENNLQDPANRRKILCDDALRSVFATDSTDMFKMNKLLTKHIWPLDDDVESKTKRLKVENDDTPDVEIGKSKEKQRTDKEALEKEGKKSKGGGGFTTPFPLSKELVEFLGTGENELPRTEVVKRLWAYIKENELQDPADKRQVKCDKKLQKLFGCDTFIGFAMTKYLSAHILKS